MITITTRHFKATKVSGRDKWVIQSARAPRTASHAEVVTRLTPKRERGVEQQQPSK
jgi:hypothetical protein